MAKYRSHRSRVRRESSRSSNVQVLAVIFLVLAAFVGGFFFARYRYTAGITAISKMNMDKAVTIDELKEQLQVLGTSTEARE